MKAMEDDRPVSDARRTQEFLDLYSACQRSLYVYIVTLIGNPIDAHDVLQDMSLVLWQKFDQFELGTNFWAWAREVAAIPRAAIPADPRQRDADFRSAGARSARGPDCRARPAARRLSTETLPDCVEQLGKADRELIRLRYLSGVRSSSLPSGSIVRRTPSRNPWAASDGCCGSALRKR